MADLKTDLAECARLAGGTTPGPWYTGHLCHDDHSCNCPFVYAEGQAGMGAVATVGTTDEDVSSPEEAKANQAMIAAAINLFHDHGDELLAVVRDAELYRWLKCGGWEVLQDPKYWRPEYGFDGAVAAARADVALDAAIDGRAG